MISNVDAVGDVCHWNFKSDNSLMAMKKTELIELIRILEHNWNAAEAMKLNQLRNFDKMTADCIDQLTKEDAVGNKLMLTSHATDIIKQTMGVDSTWDVHIKMNQR